MSKKKQAEDSTGEDGSNYADNSNFNWDGYQQQATSIKKILKNTKADTLSLDEKRDLWKAIEKNVADKDPLTSRKRVPYAKILVAALCLIVVGLMVHLHGISEYKRSIQEAARINKAYFSKENQVQFLDSKKKSYQLKSDSLYTYDQLGENNQKPSVFDRQQTSFNSVGVPYGRRSEILLEDGTKIWLNAGSVLTFPERFDKKRREVFLEGEAYFEVAADVKRPFYVISDAMHIEVLGTSFNVTAYADDDYASTTLLTGSVGVSGNGEVTFDKQLLKAGAALRVNKITNLLSINESYGAESISWTKRRLLLKSTHLHEIVRKLERFYNTEIENHTRSDLDDRFSGSLDLTQTLPQVLEHLYEHGKYVIRQGERRVYIQNR